jgi:hypothetical protein
MTSNFKNLQIKTISVDDRYFENFSINSSEFKMAYKFLAEYGIDFDEDVLLNVKTSPDSMISLLLKFLDINQGRLVDKHIL